MDTKSSHVEAIHQLVDELITACNQHDVERLERFYSANYMGIDVSESKPRRGKQGAREGLERYLMAFPDLRVTLNQIIIQENRAAILWTAAGTHQGRLMNIPPTGRAVSFRGTAFLTIAGGEVVHGFYLWDYAEFLRSIRLLPDLDETDVIK